MSCKANYSTFRASHIYKQQKYLVVTWPYVAYMNTRAKFCNISSPYSPSEMCENANPNSYFPSLFYSCAPVRPKRLNRFLRLMAQNT